MKKMLKNECVSDRYPLNGRDLWVSSPFTIFPPPDSDRGWELRIDRSRNEFLLIATGENHKDGEPMVYMEVYNVTVVTHKGGITEVQYSAIENGGYKDYTHQIDPKLIPDLTQEEWSLTIYNSDQEC